MTTFAEALWRALLPCGLALWLAGCGWWEADTPRFLVTGSLVDGAGQPVAGAVVTDGAAATLSDDQGRYRLGVRRDMLAVSKPRCPRVSWKPVPGEQPVRTLAAREHPVRVGVDPRGDQAAFRGLRELLARTTRLADWPGGHPGALDVLLLVTPRGWSGSEVGAVLRWVRGGGRLILCGEWGGYAGQDVETMRALAGPAGVDFGGGTVRTAAEDDFVVQVLRPAYQGLASALGGRPVTLIGVTALSVGGEARPLLVAPRGYVVLAEVGSRVVAAAGPLGLGKIIVLGDSSLWRDEDSTGSGQANLVLGGNSRLLEALLVW
ncbi:MAG: DUF4350 domain-containing protein [Candidatus Sericytochromatia bacterium]|nr:DUF4350 domain-containing protein [Candidatus Sericytochromatia bacterium]